MVTILNWGFNKIYLNSDQSYQSGSNHGKHHPDSKKECNKKQNFFSMLENVYFYYLINILLPH